VVLVLLQQLTPTLLVLYDRPSSLPFYYGLALWYYSLLLSFCPLALLRIFTGNPTQGVLHCTTSFFFLNPLKLILIHETI
jgi:hypothetical protein